jgi:hypothetical protein
MDIKAATGKPDGNLAGFALVAAEVDMYIAKHTGTAPLIASAFAKKLPQAALALSDSTLEVASKKAPHKTVLAYLAAVHARVGKYEKMQKSVNFSGFGGAKSATKTIAKKTPAAKRSTGKGN